MSSSIITLTNLISHQVTIYVGVPLFIFGVIGCTLNIIVFLSLKTFRQNSCALYLTLLSLANLGYLIIGLLTFVTIYGFGIDWTVQSRFYCILREGSVHIFLLIAFTCLCLATIDQYLATCSSIRCQQLCTIKLARQLCLVFTIIWILYGIAFFISYDLITIPGTDRLDCTMINDIFQQYFKTFHVLFLLGILPISITVAFGCLAYRNIRQLSYRTIPLVRRELDKQLTVMVLTQVICNFFLISPYTIINGLILHPNMMIDPVNIAIINCARILSVLLLYSCIACPFYIYIFASVRFRQQLIHVLIKTHLQRWRRQNAIVDIVLPQH